MQTSQNVDNHVLLVALSAAVPLWILELKEKGGPTREDWNWLKEAENILTNTGEAILYRTKKGDTARAFNAVAKAIAILSFVPGGIEIFGSHWESESNTA